MQKEKKCMRIWYLAGFFLLVTCELILMAMQCGRQMEQVDCQQLVQFSSTAGSPDGRARLTREHPVIFQTLRPEKGQMDELILFFYQCDQVSEGRIYTGLVDDQGEVLCEQVIELASMNQETFCQIIQSDNVWNFVPNKEYRLEIRAELSGEDQIEVGTTVHPANREVFRDSSEDELLFVGLKRTISNVQKCQNQFLRLFWVCLICNILYLVLGMVVVTAGKKGALIFAGALASIVIVGWCVKGAVARWQEKGQWYAEYHLIAHACGSIDEHAYTNSLEAFEQSYANGHKVFEVDFAVTSDGEIVLKHDWETPKGLPQFENGEIPTREEFLNAKVWDQYTTMDIRELLQLMLNHRDIYIVTDSKSKDYEEVRYQFAKINELTQEMSTQDRNHIKSHMVVQIYNNDMYVAVEDTFAPDHYLYTLYMRGLDNLDELADFCVEKKIPVVTIPCSWWSAEVAETLHSNGLKIWVHTLNTKEEIQQFREAGADGFYTDESDPGILE